MVPLNELDPAFQLDPQVATFDDTPWWDASRKVVNRQTGKLMSVPVNPNIPLLYYRKDLYDRAGLKVPKTFDELLANAKKLHNPPATYGIVQRGSRELTSITYDFFPYLYGHGAASSRTRSRATSRSRSMPPRPSGRSTTMSSSPARRAIPRPAPRARRR